MKIPFPELANRITGISTPIFGVSWDPPTRDIDIARRLLTFLEDRRVLYNPFEIEVYEWVIESVLEVRRRLTEDLEKLDRSSPLAQSIRAMRAACRQFLDDVNEDRPGRFYAPLMDLRALFGVQIAQIAVRYGIEVEEHLVSFFPSMEDSEDQ